MSIDGSFYEAMGNRVVWGSTGASLSHYTADVCHSTLLPNAHEWAPLFTPCRASNIMAAVNAEAKIRMAARLEEFRPPLADFHVGDAVEITVRVPLGTESL